MAIYFFDSSGIVKRYVQEPGTPWVIAVTNPATGNRIYLARIAGVEVVSALALQKQGGSLSVEAAATAIAQFRHDFTHQYRIIEITSALVERAMELAERHTLRGFANPCLPGRIPGSGRLRGRPGVGRGREGRERD